ncbi:MAG TPA: ACT domain-containing protein [Thermoplasmata archaeon]|jgi:hypothetical protein
MLTRDSLLPVEGSGTIQLDVDLPDRPGELAQLARVLGDAGINIDAMSANSGGGRSYMSLIVDQPTRARQLFDTAGYASRSRTVLVVRLPDEPGALAGLAGRLGAAGVDIDSVVHLETIGDHVQVAMGVDNLERARSLV